MLLLAGHGHPWPILFREAPPFPRRDPLLSNQVDCDHLLRIRSMEEYAMDVICTCCGELARSNSASY